MIIRGEWRVAVDTLKSGRPTDLSMTLKMIAIMIMPITTVMIIILRIALTFGEERHHFAIKFGITPLYTQPPTFYTEICTR